MHYIEAHHVFCRSDLSLFLLELFFNSLENLLSVFNHKLDFEPVLQIEGDNLVTQFSIVDHGSDFIEQLFPPFYLRWQAVKEDVELIFLPLHLNVDLVVLLSSQLINFLHHY